MKRAKPLIGITTDLKDNHNSIEEYYSKAIVKYGGLPVLIPTVERQISYLTDIIKKIDGLFLPGSRDMDPQYYQQEPHPKINPMNKERTETEFAALKIAMENKKPVLGICGGMQLINVFCKGSLYQDIKSLINNSLTHEEGSEHLVKIQEGSKLRSIVKDKEFNVKSYHHQAVNRLGNELIVNAISPDGVIEGIEHKNLFVLGIQWHPELEDTKQSKHIFESFLMECANM